ncbi:MAG: PBP1A family penicillin-binding protein [Deltaproteobacteria bacterium]|nr:PBP1A family penicillin-binding protein [Deltaproteobacteria bacterium]
MGMTHKQITLFIAFVVFSGGICGIVAGAFVALTSDLPQIQSLENYKPAAVTRIFSADGVLLAELFSEKRDPVPLQTVPDALKAAIIATEDRNFYQHSGVDVRGVLRAIVRNIWAGEYAEGASTISQQLAKTLFLTPKKTLARKIKEAFLAFQLERRYTKDEILELYLNQIYFGSGAYGVESASRAFFGKSVKDLSLSECALIAGMPKAPSRYSPLVNLSLAKQRRDTVLRQMKETGIINEEQYQQSIKDSIDLSNREQRTVKAPYFVDYVRQALESIIGATKLYKEGFIVHTTLRYRLQSAAQAAVANGLSDLEKRMRQRRMKTVRPQAALVALDILTGGIVAMVGGRDYYESPYNRAIHARRQPGSAFKPIVYALAIERGFPQHRMILDAPVVFRGGREAEDWRPENFSKTYKGEITLRHALAVSENIPAVRLIEMLGVDSVAQFAHSLGIRSQLQQNLTLALGTSEVSLLNLTEAYAVFANKSLWIEPFGISEIVDRTGRIVWRARPKKKIVMSRAAAAIMTNMLQAVINEGTGKKARNIGGQIAGKTGTTNDFRDALFVGYTPAIAAGVWVGQDSYVSLGSAETGARAALPIWIEFMKTVIEDAPVQYFDIPDDVVSLRIDPVTGLLTQASSDNGVVALFKKGTEPDR